MTINQCLAQLKTYMDAAFVSGSGGDGSANYTYDYRTFPDKLAVTISLSFQGRGLEETSDARGRRIVGEYYNITAVIGAQMAVDANGDITETAIRNADQALNTLENGIYTLLDAGGNGNSSTYWHSVSFPQESTRPPSFTSAPTTRYGEIPFRLHLKGGVKRFQI